MKFSAGSANQNYKKLFGIITAVLIVIGIPLTVVFIQNNQDIRQRASGSETATPISLFNINGTTYNADETVESGGPKKNYHVMINNSAGHLTIDHDVANYQFYQYLRPDDGILLNKYQSVNVILAGTVSSTPYLPSPPYPTFARLQLENKDTGAILGYIEPGHGGSQTITIPQGVTVAITIRAVNADASFSGLALVIKRSSGNSFSWIDIWRNNKTFHNAITGGIVDLSGTPALLGNLTSRTSPTVSGGQHINLADDPGKTQAVYSGDVFSSFTPDAKFRITGTMNSSQHLANIPTFAKVQVDLTPADSSCPDNKCSYDAGQEFTVPAGKTLNIILRSWNANTRFSDIRLVKTVAPPAPVVTVPAATATAVPTRVPLAATCTGGGISVVAGHDFNLGVSVSGGTGPRSYSWVTAGGTIRSGGGAAQDNVTLNFPVAGGGPYTPNVIVTAGSESVNATCGSITVLPPAPATATSYPLTAHGFLDSNRNGVEDAGDAGWTDNANEIGVVLVNSSTGVQSNGAFAGGRGTDSYTFSVPNGSYTVGVNFSSNMLSSGFTLYNDRNNIPVTISGAGQTINFPIEAPAVAPAVTATSVPACTVLPKSSGNADPGDCVINLDDLIILRDTFGSRTDLRADFNGDGVVDITDFGIIRDYIDTH